MVDYMAGGLVISLAVIGISSLMVGASSNSALDASILAGLASSAFAVYATVMVLAVSGYLCW